MLSRRCFVVHSAQALLAHLAPQLAAPLLITPQDDPSEQMFDWGTDSLRFRFGVVEGRLRQFQLTPANFSAPLGSCGVETAIQCDGENSPDQGMKVGVGQPGLRLVSQGSNALKPQEASASYWIKTTQRLD